MKIDTPLGTHETQREHVYHQLKHALMAGTYEPGQKITLAAVSQALGVSATPVREAMRRLVAERALVMHPNRSVEVPRLSREEVLQIRDVRQQLEPYAARLATARVDAETLEGLRQTQLALAAARDRRDVRRILALNEAFHFVVYEASGVPVLRDMIANLWQMSAPTLGLIFRPEHIGRYPKAAQTRNNARLIDALARRDADAAAKAVRDEIAEGSRLLRDLMGDGERKGSATVVRTPRGVRSRGAQGR